MRKALDRVQDRLPFRHGLARHERLEAGDQRSQFLPGGHPRLVAGRDPGVLLVLRPVAVAGHVGRHHRSTPGTLPRENDCSKTPPDDA